MIKTLYVTSRKDRRKRLLEHFDKEKEVWLVYPKKSSGKERILYNNALEETLCFGWIDSTIKFLDEENSIRCFSPRNSGSTYSQQNMERMKWI